MATVHKSVILNHSAEHMYTLVDRIEDYPLFLPWCGGVDVRRQPEEHRLVATLHIHYHGIKQSFSTENVHEPFSSMTMQLVEGPFKHLTGRWQFKSLRADACRVEFFLEYEFSSKILEQLIGPVFTMIANNFVEAFCKRAEEVYGTR